MQKVLTLLRFMLKKSLFVLAQAVQVLSSVAVTMQHQWQQAKKHINLVIHRFFGLTVLKESMLKKLAL